MPKNKFATLLRELRGDQTLKSIATPLGISITFFNDLEKGNREPSEEFLKKLVILYNMNEVEQRYLYDAAASIKGTLPYDVTNFLIENPDVLNMVIAEMNRKNSQKNQR